VVWAASEWSGRSFAEIASAEGVTRRYVARLIPLAFLAPDIVEKILSGDQPVDLTTDELTKRIDLPLDWAEQRGALGFDWGIDGRIKSEREPLNLAVEKNAFSGFIRTLNPPSPVRFRDPFFPKPRGIAGFSRSNPE
jgi:hypothetical protein